VQWTNSAFALTHEKTIVIDGQEVFILNQNLTTTSFSKNREYDIEDTNPADVTQVRNIFIADWERNSPTITDDNLVVSPVSSRERITSLIQSATKEIDVEIEDINDSRITDLLSEKAKTMQVEIIAPTVAQIASNKKSLSALQASGAKVKMISSPYIHAKLIIIDDAKAYIGSVNLSSQSMDENRELGILLSQSDILQELTNYFDNDWEKN
jgi:phosphatidylserine/phosphatidylglycerophosphate/cardiolipin synthase-like enzyme